jgi:hypothetical protein
MVLSVLLRFTDSDYSFGIKRFFHQYEKKVVTVIDEDSTNINKTIDEDSTNINKTIDEDSTYINKTIDEDSTYINKTIDEDSTHINKTIDEDSTNINKANKYLSTQTIDHKIETKLEIQSHAHLLY